MGTTLAHGIYLPSEGERNCYAGLKLNWETLDQKVADISALQSAIAGALHREIVASLPTTDIDTATIYMILNGTSATENIYDEYMYISNAWELIGTSATDLTNYYTKAEVDGKLLLKASASDLTSHTGDTTIHVTASDKAKWTNSANTHVLRLALSALTPSTSDNSFSNLDDSTALKVGDKVIDPNGVLYEVTAVDTTNEKFTIGTAIDAFAKNSNVVHNSGNETVGGIKTFSDDTYIKSLNFTNEVPSQSSSSSSLMPIIATITYGDSTPSAQARLNFRITADGSKSLYPHENNQYSLGLASRKWSAVYGTAFYYGSNAVEFSDKFVTADTSQTITGAKSWANAQVWSVDCQRRMTNGIEKGDVPSTSVARNDYYTLKNGSTTYAGALGVFGCALIDNNAVSTYFHAIKNVAGSTTRTTLSVKYYTNTDERTIETNGDIIPTASSQNLGNSTSKWSTINGLTPSSLGMPDLNSGVDISSYVTVVANANKESLYTPPANGWICVRLSRTSGALGVLLIQGDLAISGKNIEVESGVTTADATIPVIGGVQVSINSALADGVVSAKFFPCLGNV